MTAKILSLFSLLLLSISIGCGAIKQNIDDPNPKNPPVPVTAVSRSGVVFVGDSLFGRWDLDSYFPGKGYVNAGWFGQRTDQILAVFPKILDGSSVCHGYNGNPPDPSNSFPFSCPSIQPPAEVVILLGWNDEFQAKDPATAVANIETMVNMATAAKVKVVLVVPYRYDSAFPASWMQPFNPCSGGWPFSDSLPTLNAGIKAVAANHGLQLVNLESLFLNGCQSDYTIDGVHPNANGYQQMHDAFASII